ncbi:hypothetical protein B0H19DRAFT_1063452 [Mycena capillaripes]|nr:hypothetical protein B0H19DRAFT_1063452 [Mycena capillaripes]
MNSLSLRIAPANLNIRIIGLACYPLSSIRDKPNLQGSTISLVQLNLPIILVGEHKNISGQEDLLTVAAQGKFVLGRIMLDERKHTSMNGQDSQTVAGKIALGRIMLGEREHTSMNGQEDSPSVAGEIALSDGKHMTINGQYSPSVAGKIVLSERGHTSMTHQEDSQTVSGKIALDERVHTGINREEDSQAVAEKLHSVRESTPASVDEKPHLLLQGKSRSKEHMSMNGQDSPPVAGKIELVQREHMSMNGQDSPPVAGKIMLDERERMSIDGQKDSPPVAENRARLESP